MLTNVLLIIILIMLLSSFVYMNKKHKELVKQQRVVFQDLFSKLRNLSSELSYFEVLNGKYMTGLNEGVQNNKELLLTIRKDYLDRLETQERLIAKLKETQAPEEVVDTINLIDEWMNGPVETKK